MKDLENRTYLSREDSELLRKALAVTSGKALLEIGVGYGSNLTSVSGHFDTIVGTDIQRTEAFEAKRGSTANLVIADSATCFRSSLFDVVVMNPPYLPSDGIADPTTDGGKNGFEIPRKFLDEALRVASPEGKVLILLSSATNLELFKEYCNNMSVACTTLLKQHIFFETIYVFEIRKNDAGAPNTCSMQ